VFSWYLFLDNMIRRCRIKHLERLTCRNHLWINIDLVIADAHSHRRNSWLHSFMNIFFFNPCELLLTLAHEFVRPLSLLVMIILLLLLHLLLRRCRNVDWMVEKMLGLWVLTRLYLSSVDIELILFVSINRLSYAILGIEIISVCRNMNHALSSVAKQLIFVIVVCMHWNSFVIIGHVMPILNSSCLYFSFSMARSRKYMFNFSSKSQA